MAVFASLQHTIERRLYGMGFTLPEARRLMCIQMLVAASGLLAGVLFFWFSLWPLAFGLGALVMTYSLWHIIKFVQLSVRQRFTAALGIRLGLGFSARLLLIGAALFTLIVLLKVPVAPLVLGLTSTVAGIVLWGISRSSRKPVKEA